MCVKQMPITIRERTGETDPSLALRMTRGESVGRGVVLAKSAALCFRLTAKMRSAPLLVLSPRDPLRWARAGPLIARPGTTLFVGRDDSARQTTSETHPHPALRATFPLPGGRFLDAYLDLPPNGGKV